MMALIDEALLLVGQPLWGVDDAAGMLMLQFGDRTLEQKRSGKQVPVGAFSLHVQCPWRLREGSSIIAGFQDDNPTRLEAWIRTEPKVSKATFDDLGGLTLEFSDGRIVEVFPASSSLADGMEYWRLLLPREGERKHVVVSGTGVERC